MKEQNLECIEIEDVWIPIKNESLLVDAVTGYVSCRLHITKTHKQAVAAIKKGPVVKVYHPKLAKAGISYLTITQLGLPEMKAEGAWSVFLEAKGVFAVDLQIFLQGINITELKPTAFDEEMKKILTYVLPALKEHLSVNYPSSSFDFRIEDKGSRSKRDDRSWTCKVSRHYLTSQAAAVEYAKNVHQKEESEVSEEAGEHIFDLLPGRKYLRTSSYKQPHTYHDLRFESIAACIEWHCELFCRFAPHTPLKLLGALQRLRKNPKE